MKCVIYCKNEYARWVNRYFKDIPPYLLKILNKPLLEYYLDFCVMMSIRDVRIIMDNPSQLIEKYFDDGSRWGVNLSYGLARPGDSLNDVFAKNKTYCRNTDLMVIEGFMSIDYDRRNTKYGFFEDLLQPRSLNCDSGRILLFREQDLETVCAAEQIAQFPSVEPALLPLASIKDYYTISMDILKHKDQNYVLPGYHSEPDVFIGMNVEIPPTARVVKPVMIGNNVQLKKLTLIGPDAIIGDNVIIDSATSIDHSIIYDNSFVGSNLEIKGKIVYKNTLMSPEITEVMLLDDKILINKLSGNFLTVSLRPLFHWVMALIMVILGFIPYLIMRLLMVFSKDNISQTALFYLNKDKKRILMSQPLDKALGVIGKIVYHLSLDKYPLLLHVLIFQIKLTGNRPLKVNADNMLILDEMYAYYPGVFCYSEMTGSYHKPVEMLMDENYYCHNVSLWTDIKILYKSLLNRLTAGF